MKGFMPVKKTTNSTIQQINRKNIFRILYEGDGMTKQDVMATLHLSLPTTTQNIQNLMAKGLITESGSVGNTGGRRAKTYDIMPDAKMAIGLDITRNHHHGGGGFKGGDLLLHPGAKKLFQRG